MFKLMVMIARRANVSHDALIESWEHIHAPNVIEEAKPLRYWLTFFEQQQAEEDPGYDGMLETWFRDRAHFETAMAAGADSKAKSDGFDELMDPAKTQMLTVTENIFVEGPVSRDSTKLVIFIQRKEGTERAALTKYWLETHAPAIATAINATPSAKRYTVDIAQGDSAYDGIAQISLDGINPSFDDIQGYEPDAFMDFVQSVQIARGHEVRLLG